MQESYVFFSFLLVKQGERQAGAQRRGATGPYLVGTDGLTAAAANVALVLYAGLKGLSSVVKNIYISIKY